jgi:hypothetical protein
VPGVRDQEKQNIEYRTSNIENQEPGTLNLEPGTEHRISNIEKTKFERIG